MEGDFGEEGVTKAPLPPLPRSPLAWPVTGLSQAVSLGRFGRQSEGLSEAVFTNEWRLSVSQLTVWCVCVYECVCACMCVCVCACLCVCIWVTVHVYMGDCASVYG